MKRITPGSCVGVTGKLIASQGKAQEIGGYYHPNDELAFKAMRPSETLNNTLASL